jgi:hypothetical protein
MKIEILHEAEEELNEPIACHQEIEPGLPQSHWNDMMWA